MVSNFAHGWRHAVFLGVLLDVFVDFGLAVGQFFLFGIFHLEPLKFVYINIVHSWANVNSFTAQMSTFYEKSGVSSV